MRCFARVLYLTGIALLAFGAMPILFDKLTPSTPVEIVPHCPAGDGMFLPCADVRPTFSI